MSERYHFIGIGGIGMSALARILLQRGAVVSGSDLSDTPIIKELRSLGANIIQGHSAENITQNAVVVYSSAVKEDNVEYQTAKQQQNPLVHRSLILKQLMEGYKTLAVAGTHGKTTTSSLLTSVLEQAMLEPSFAVGGLVQPYNVNGSQGNGEYFVAEADESDGSFLNYTVFGSIVTNIEGDHLDHYGSEENLHMAFKKFVDEHIVSSDHCFWCGDDNNLKALAPKGISYGFGNNCQWRAVNCRQDGWKMVFDIANGESNYKDIEISAIGEHNILNAAAVFALAMKLGIPEESIRKTFRTFHGVKRRMDYRKINGITLIDDYAHHPTAVAMTLNAIRKAAPYRRILVAFQPHRYSRTQDCLGNFGAIFDAADEVFVTDIYSAGEKPIDGIDSSLIVEEITNESSITTHYVNRNDIVSTLADKARPHDIIVTMGAGDITKCNNELYDLFNSKPPRKLVVGVIVGGRAPEHDVSLMSGSYFSNGLFSEYYDVHYFAINKQGQWQYNKNYDDLLGELSQHIDNENVLSQDIWKRIMTCDLFIPVLHGRCGEDGMIQGFLETIGKPYVGCDYSACALAMNKGVTKCLAQQYGIPTVPFVDITAQTWKENNNTVIEMVNKELSYPIFVKPSHQGSTIGISKVDDEKDLIQAVEKALSCDTRLIIEQAISEVREIEFSFIGNRIAVGEVSSKGNLYTYDKKYGASSFGVTIPDLDEDLLAEGMKLVKEAYNMIEGAGMARIDFFLDQQNNWWLNEINPFPGCTKNSMYPVIWQYNNVQATDVIDELVVLGLYQHRMAIK